MADIVFGVYHEAHNVLNEKREPIAYADLPCMVLGLNQDGTTQLVVFGLGAMEKGTSQSHAAALISANQGTKVGEWSLVDSDWTSLCASMPAEVTKAVSAVSDRIGGHLKDAMADPSLQKNVLEAFEKGFAGVEVYHARYG